MIHPSAIVHPDARLGTGCVIGPYCIVGEHVELGEDCKLHAHVVLDGHTKLGKANEVFPFASLGLKTQDLKWTGGVTHVEIGDHNTFREGVTVHSATDEGGVTRVGSHNNLLAYSHVAHDCEVGNNVVMSNVATLAGHVTVEDHAIVGGLTAIHQFCRVGRLAMVGGCARVVQDIPPFMLAEGSPATPRTVNKVGMERSGVSEEAQVALRQAYKLIYRGGLTTSNALMAIEKELPPLPEILHLINFIRSSDRGIARSRSRAAD
jgi:UDP-N-acetylglucosamine acyltransferase